ncbi:MAG: hypothetical protein AAFO94_23005, partial [Bacteroidota bacterium]
MNDFHHWRQAVGSTGSIGENFIFDVELIVVDTEYDGLYAFALGRCRDDYFFTTRTLLSLI